MHLLNTLPQRLDAGATPTFAGLIAPSLTSPASTDLTLGTGTFGTALTVASATGNVGIGTTSPSTNLEVNGALNYSYGNIAVESTHNEASGISFSTTMGSPNASSRKWKIQSNTSAYGTLEFFHSTTNSNAPTVNAVTIDGNGNVGIGTTAPRGAFEVVSGTVNTGANTTVAIIVGANRIMSSTFGTLAVTSNDAQAIDIGGSIVFGGRTTDSSTIEANWAAIKSGKNTTVTGDHGGYLAFGTRTTSDSLGIVEKMRILGSGEVGIGTTTPSYQLHVNTDSAGKPGAGGLWTVVSDERIKTDIVPADLSRCYDIVKQVGLKHFGFKAGVYSDEQINDKHSLGWIAQDVQKVFGKAVSIKPFTLQTDIPDGTEEYDEQEFTVETINKVETSIQVINGKPVQASKTTQVEEKTLLFDEVVVVDVAGEIVMVDGAPLTHKVPRMVTKTRPKVRREVIKDCLDLNGGQMNAALYGAVQCLMEKVEAQAVIIASLQADKPTP